MIHGNTNSWMEDILKIKVIVNMDSSIKSNKFLLEMISYIRGVIKKLIRLVNW